MIHEYGAKKVPGHKSVNVGVAENRTDPRAEGDAAAEAGPRGRWGVCTCRQVLVRSRDTRLASNRGT